MATFQSFNSSGAIGQTTTTTTITKPSGVAVGDLLVTGLYCYGTTDNRSITTLSGWTALTSQASTQMQIAIYTRTADSTDVSASNYTWTCSGSAHFGGFMVRLSSWGLLSGFASGANSATSGSNTFSGFTPTRANCLFLAFTGTGRQSRESDLDMTGVSMVTSNPSWTERGEIDLDVTNQTHAFALYTATRPESTATGNITYTFTDFGTTKQNVGIVIAVSPQVNGSLTPITTGNVYAFTGMAHTTVEAMVDTPSASSFVPTTWTPTPKS